MQPSHRTVSRRGLVTAAAPSALTAPPLSRAGSAPIRIGLLSDAAGPYRNVGGPGAKVAVELAVEDIGGSLLDRPLEVIHRETAALRDAEPQQGGTLRLAAKQARI